MRAYSASEEEALHARDLLKDWLGEDLLRAEQYGRMEQETVCDLRRTNIFLRLVLFLFTLIVAGAVVGLFFTAAVPHSTDQTQGVFLLIFAGICYAAAEGAISTYRLYRYGIEEALAVCSAGFLLVGMRVGLFGGLFSSHSQGFLVPAAGAAASLWFWHRFGLPYAPFAAMVFVAWVPGYWTSSPWAQHLMVAALYSIGLAIVIAARPGHRLTCLDSEYSIAEALLWLGIYLAINLQISSVDLIEHLWRGGGGVVQFPRPFYWSTWVLTWCLSPVMLVRGLRMKDRWLIAAGGIAAILTLITNKPYLGWQRHTWDPILLGCFLIGVALLVQRWLAKGPGGIRHNFTARRLSGKDRRWMNVGVAALGFASPDIVTPRPQTSSAEPHFGGGDSGGGGASSEF